MLLRAAQLRVDRRQLQVMLLMSQWLQCNLPLPVQLFASAAVFLLSPQWLAVILLKGDMPNGLLPRRQRVQMLKHSS